MTAQWVAACRAVDAKAATPLIGSNVGQGPDTMAATLCGAAGDAFLDEYCAALRASRASCGERVARRTMHFDAGILAAVGEGCAQLVVLAAGLDTRAWRLPFDDKMAVYEVDQAAAFAYKDPHMPPTICKRVPVAADFRDGDWADALVAAGFDPKQRACFLAEGLFMYMPRPRPPLSRAPLFGQIAALAAPGSVLIGDCFCNLLSTPAAAKIKTVLAKYGAAWTSEFATTLEFENTLAAAGWLLDGPRVKVHTVGGDPNRSTIWFDGIRDAD